MFGHPWRLTVWEDRKPMPEPTRKEKGDLAELMVACDLRRRGCKIAIPFGEESDYDLVIERDGALERVQVKYVESNGRVINVQCRSNSLTNGKVRAIKRYTAATIDWMAVYDRTSDACYYIRASELGNGRDMITLRLVEPANGQRVGIRFAEDHTDLDE
ncbi:MAG: group I intron-associated PD-(D/E)XK endonuclease [Solirubrobacterales bacterium]